MFTTDRTERALQDSPMAEEVKTAKAVVDEQDEPAADDEEIAAAKSAKTPAAQGNDSVEDEEMIPTRRRVNKKRRIQRDSSVDENSAADEPMQDLQEPKTPVTNKSSAADMNLRLSEEQTAMRTPDKPLREAAPGMKWVQVKSTEQLMDNKGYMVFQDVTKWEEIEDMKPIKRAAPAKSAGVKSDGTSPAAAGVKKATSGGAAQKKGAKVQSALASFFSVKQK